MLSVHHSYLHSQQFCILWQLYLWIFPTRIKFENCYSSTQQMRWSEAILLRGHHFYSTASLRLAAPWPFVLILYADRKWRSGVGTCHRAWHVHKASWNTQISSDSLNEGTCGEKRGFYNDWQQWLWLLSAALCWGRKASRFLLSDGLMSELAHIGPIARTRQTKPKQLLFHNRMVNISANYCLNTANSHFVTI